MSTASSRPAVPGAPTESAVPGPTRASGLWGASGPSAAPDARGAPAVTTTPAAPVTSASAAFSAAGGGKDEPSARDAAHGSPGPGVRPPRFPRLPRARRRALLVVHVVVSAGWLGLTAGILALGFAGRFSGDAATARAAYLALGVFGDWLLVPVSLASLLSGVWLGLGTSWGLLRHRWVAVKLVVTVGATAATVFALRPNIVHAAGAAASGSLPDGESANGLVAAPCVALTLYLFVTAVSVLKPWGLTGYGRRLRERRKRSGPAQPSP